MTSIANMLKRVSLKLIVILLQKLRKTESMQVRALFWGDVITDQIILDGTFEIWELKTIEKFITDMKDRVVLDVGANIGNHTIYFSKIAKSVVAFEPNPIVFSVLQANTYSFDNVKIFNFGLSDTDANLELTFDNRNYGGGTMESDIGRHSVTTQVRKFENVLDDEITISPDVPVFIKIDVEGHEWKVLKGMRDFLSARDCVIAVEHLGRRSSMQYEELRQCGYRHFIFLERHVPLKGVLGAKLAKSLFQASVHASSEKRPETRDQECPMVLCSKNQLQMD